MKKGTEVWTEYDRTGKWMLCIGKVRGKLSLQEIRAAAMEWDEDIYVMPIFAMGDLEDIHFGFSVPNNDGTQTHYDDLVQLYRMEDVWKNTNED